MKSSTIHRSALSRENMNVIENLTNDENNYSYNNYSEEDNTPGEYKRENDPTESKNKEIDLLWQSFRPSQFNTNSPMMCALGGFVLGVIVTTLSMYLIGATSHKTVSAPKVQPEENIEQTVDDAQTIIDKDLPLAAGVEENSEAPVPSNMKKYVIKDGDTVEAIIKHFYGSYSTERAEAIMKANNLKNLDRISIDQVLLIPVEE